MSFDRQKLADAFRQLENNSYWRHYVTTLEEQFSDRTKALLLSDHPDETLRGECRALWNLLYNINAKAGGLT